MYVEKKKIHGRTYLYLKKSIREGKTVRTKTIAYLGKIALSKTALAKKIALLTLLESSSREMATLFLEPAQLQKLGEIKKDFTKKIRELDAKLLDEMFRDFKTYYIYNTNSIEGNTLTQEETNLLLNEKKTPEGKDLREIYDHLNERDTFDYLLHHKPQITIQTIIDIQTRLLKNIDARIGSFRRHNVRVVGAEFTPTEANYVSTDMKLLMKWYETERKKLHPLILAAIFHEKFERIHPFYDGNGRTGRMLLNLILIKHQFPPLIIKNIARKEYYRVLSIGHKARLTKTEAEYYREIVQFCYQQLRDTHEQIFAHWG